MHERVYVGGRLEGYVNVFDIDAPKYASYPDDRFTQLEQRHLDRGASSCSTRPARGCANRCRTTCRSCGRSITRARSGASSIAPREDRLRYLERVGTRFVILPTPPFPGATPLARLAGVDQLQLYDFNPGARRTYVVPDALMGKDVAWQLEGMFQARFDPAKGVLVSEPPPPAAGTPGPGVAPYATFVEDGLNRVVIRAGLAGGRLSRAARLLQSGLDGRRRRRGRAADARQRALPRRPPDARASTSSPSPTARDSSIWAPAITGADARSGLATLARWARDGCAQRHSHECREVRGVARRGRSSCSRCRLVSRSSACSPPAIFFVRDLSFFFWSRHLWLRHTIARRRGAVVGSVRRGRAVGDRRRAEPAADAGDAGDPAAAVDGRRRSISGSRCRCRWRRSGRSCSCAAACRRQAAAARARAPSRSRGRSSRCSTLPNLSWSVALMPWVLLACDACSNARPPRRCRDARDRLRAAGALRRAGDLGVDGGRGGRVRRSSA